MSTMPILENPCGAYSRYEITKSIPLDRLEEICTAERDGRLWMPPCKAGDTVWIIERNECGEAVDYCGYMFLAVSVGVAIVSAFIDNFETAEETINFHISETAEGCDTSLYVIPIEDCYLTRAEAEAALKEVKQDG